MLGIDWLKWWHILILAFVLTVISGSSEFLSAIAGFLWLFLIAYGIYKGIQRVVSPKSRRIKTNTKRKRNGNVEIGDTIFQKCPVCKKSKVQETLRKGLFGTKTETICSTCHAVFEEEDEKEGERVFTLDLSNSDKENKYEGEALKVSEWKRGMSDLDACIKHNTLPKANVEGISIVLQSGEQPHWASDTRLVEERAVRRGYGGKVRVMKGVYVGPERRYESHGELRQIDSGVLLLTNKRLVFNGGFRTLEYKLDKIVSVEEHIDAVEIGASNRKKVQIFMVAEPHKWTEFIKIAIRKHNRKKKKRG